MGLGFYWCRISKTNSENINQVPPAVAGPLVFFIETYENFGAFSFFSTIFFVIEFLCFFSVCVVSQIVPNSGSPLCSFF